MTNMPTINQLIKNWRKAKKKKSKSPVLQFSINKLKNNKKVEMPSPFKRWVCLKVWVMGPKKPNSAQRKFAKVRLSNWAEVLAYIPGQSHTLQEHSVVLVKGWRVKELFWVKYHIMVGKDESKPVPERKQGRSLYGVKRSKS